MLPLSSVLIPISISPYRRDILKYIKQAGVPGNPRPCAGRLIFALTDGDPHSYGYRSHSIAMRPPCPPPFRQLSAIQQVRRFPHASPPFLRGCVQWDGTVAPDRRAPRPWQGRKTLPCPRCTAGRSVRAAPPFRVSFLVAFHPPAFHANPTEKETDDAR